MDVLVCGGTVVLETGPAQVDILIHGERIQTIGAGLRATGARRIDAKGMYVLPGGIDAHTHFTIGSDDWRTGSIAAAFGGTTTVIDHPGFGPAGCSIFQSIEEERRKARGASVVDYSFHGVLQRVDEGVLRDLGRLVRQGIPSVKAYLTYDFRLEERELRIALARLRELGGLLAVHCEDHEIIMSLRERFEREGKVEPWYHALSRPPEAEAGAVAQVIRLVEELAPATRDNRGAGAGAGLGVASGARHRAKLRAAAPPVYIVHLSTARAVAEVRRARSRGLPIHAETCPQYLLLDEEQYREPYPAGLECIMSPPLRTASDGEALWEALRDGTVEVVATDHCPYFLTDKTKRSGGSFLACPNGAPGVETRLPLLFQEGVMKGRIPLERFARLCATTPARLMGLYPRKGVIAQGSDADLVLIDPRKRRRLRAAELHHNCDYTPFEGWEVTGYPDLVMLRGMVIVEQGTLIAEPGSGRFLRRQPTGCVTG